VAADRVQPCAVEVCPDAGPADRAHLEPATTAADSRDLPNRAVMSGARGVVFVTKSFVDVGFHDGIANEVLLTVC
jgi:hypothetical protein